ncbi:MAG: transglutaminase family protein [Dermatophilaceae bacterium]|nr:transglutaminase family protein [Intrasporangiaceae bacterium]
MTSPAATRDLSSSITLDVTAPAELVLSIAVADSVTRSSEDVSFTVDGTPLSEQSVSVLTMRGGTRLHRLSDVPVGTLVISYRAVVEAGAVDGEPVTDLAEIVYTRPSRYCGSDRLAAVAATHFGELSGRALIDGIAEWVHANIAYTLGSSDVTDGALEAYLSRQGVCRDLAQLVITFCRARGVPARLVSVYAPGLTPMDFHAVAEVAVDGLWEVVDATRLAPRESLVRIATGRDAADTAFLTTLSGRTTLMSMQVLATAGPDLPQEDPRATVRLA